MKYSVVETLYNNIINMCAFKYRSRATIVKDILGATARKGRKKTHIMQTAKVNYYQVNKYLSFLIVNGLIYVDHEDRYRMTDRGLEFYKALESLSSKLR